MINTKHEDAIMKMGFGYFRESILKRLGIVIYSGGIRNAVTELNCGFYTYRVEPVYLAGYDADKIFKRLKEKMNRIMEKCLMTRILPVWHLHH